MVTVEAPQPCVDVSSKQLTEFTGNIVEAIKKVNQEGLTTADLSGYQETLEGYKQLKKEFMMEKEKIFRLKKKKSLVKKGQRQAL